ncbi:hypothetical protein D5S17_29195 [Pseudonocardiaceae bacterium YIM PH 21723]|nr:hypothetical protein D5S17_29195 [Pseudonocardiaceae bacterium YIM PH 21723]
MRRSLSLAIAATLTVGLAPVATAVPLPLLLADSNRDGVADFRDAGSRQDAIFLPNLDDSARRCVPTEADLYGPAPAADVRMAACNDAADEVVNGDEDLKDLAPLVLRPAKVSGPGRISADTDKVRLFVLRDGQWISLGTGGELSEQELRHGAQLRLEGRDIVRDRAAWNGRVTVTVSLPRGRSDSVRLRVAPVLLQNDLRAPTMVVTSRLEGTPGYRDFLGGLKATGADPQIWGDAEIWIQDTAEPATAAMPGPGGVPRVMRVALKAPNYDRRGRGREWFGQRGPGVAIVQTPPSGDTTRDFSVNSTGNLESLPPYPGHPLGRPFYGSAKREVDPVFQTLLKSQYDSPPVIIDTDWLAVGHVDETLHVIPAANRLGWTLMVADPRLAVKLLRGADQDARLHSDTSTPGRTVRENLADPVFLANNEEAAGHIDRQLAIMLRETGLRDSDLVRVPVLFGEPAPPDPEGGTPTQTTRYAAGKTLVAASADIVNGISLSGGVLALPRPHAVDDLFERATEQALRGHPVTVRWVEDWDYLHTREGEIHCGTNAFREPTVAAWWRS